MDRRAGQLLRQAPPLGAPAAPGAHDALQATTIRARDAYAARAEVRAAMTELLGAASLASFTPDIATRLADAEADLGRARPDRRLAGRSSSARYRNSTAA